MVYTGCCGTIEERENSGLTDTNRNNNFARDVAQCRIIDYSEYGIC